VTVPKSYLFTAPHDAGPDSFGNAIDANDLIAKLRKLEPRIHVWQQFPDYKWYPGKSRGTTCMWLGDPGGSSRKITAFNMGPIPEFTVLNSEGDIQVKGWRAIFHRVMTVTNITKAQLESTFDVSLAVGPHQPICEQCLRAHGKIVRTPNKERLCNFHLGSKRIVDKVLDSQNENDYQRRVTGVEPDEPLPATPDKHKVSTHVSDNS
jgi:hypothetical protein